MLHEKEQNPTITSKKRLSSLLASKRLRVRGTKFNSVLRTSKRYEIQQYPSGGIVKTVQDNPFCSVFRSGLIPPPFVRDRIIPRYSVTFPSHFLTPVITFGGGVYGSVGTTLLTTVYERFRV